MAASAEYFVNIWRVSILKAHRNSFVVTPKGHYSFLRPGEESTSPFEVFLSSPYKRQETIPYSSPIPSNEPQQQYANYTHGYSNLRPPPLNTAYLSSGLSMNRTSSHGSSDSGYATRTPSVASPISQQNYPAQSYPVQSYAVQSYYPAQSYSVQSYPVQSCGSSRQLSQPSADDSYRNQRNPGIEIVHTPPVSSSKHKKERRPR
ncbi:MAG: hypothetical protein Q9175_002751 [Cornicularia normoerica]